MDSKHQLFHPPRRRGLAFNLGLILLLSSGSLALLYMATQTPLGPLFLAYLLGALFIAVPIPTLSSRTYALVRSFYEVQREGIRLKWGFREVAIPITDIEYVELAEDLLFPLEFPRMQWPGAVTGQNYQDRLGTVEYLAAERRGMVMIGTPEHVFVISPEKPKQFVLTYRKMIEMGSISPLPAHSGYPSFFLVEIWRNIPMRILLVLTTILSIALFGLVAWAVPTLEAIPLGFDAEAQPLPPVSPVQLFLLPSLNILLIVGSYLVSIWFYRQEENHPFITILWSSTTLTALLFLIAVLFILGAS